MKPISELTEDQIEILATTWALKFNRPVAIYFSIIRNLKEGNKAIEECPHFIVLILTQWGYYSPECKNIYGVLIIKDECQAGCDPIVSQLFFDSISTREIFIQKWIDTRINEQCERDTDKDKIKFYTDEYVYQLQRIMPVPYTKEMMEELPFIFNYQ